MAELTATHQSILKKLRADTGAEDLSLDLDKTIAAMEKRYSPSSYRAVITALRRVYPDDERIKAEMKKRMASYKEIATTQEPTSTQVAAYIPWDKIIAWRDSATLPILDKLLVGLYTYLPPQRVDYTPMRVVTRLPKTLADYTNYVVMRKKSASFVFHCYKTAKVFGDRVVDVPAPLFALLKEYLGERRDGFLFEDKSLAWTRPRLASNLRRIFLTAFGKLVSVNALRHSFITKQYAGMPSLHKLETDAVAMGHSLITHQAYRHIPLEDKIHHVPPTTK